MVALIRQQKVRSNLTGLEQIRRFDGLASIICVTDMFPQEQECTSDPFRRFLQILEAEPTPELLRICGFEKKFL
jgi:hypothetical protein